MGEGSGRAPARGYPRSSPGRVGPSACARGPSLGVRLKGVLLGGVSIAGVAPGSPDAPPFVAAETPRSGSLSFSAFTLPASSPPPTPLSFTRPLRSPAPDTYAAIKAGRYSEVSSDRDRRFCDSSDAGSDQSAARSLARSPGERTAPFSSPKRPFVRRRARKSGSLLGMFWSSDKALQVSAFLFPVATPRHDNVISPGIRLFWTRSLFKRLRMAEERKKKS